MRQVTIQCRDSSPAWDQQKRVVLVEREDDDAWYGRTEDNPSCPVMTWPKYAWKLVPEVGASEP